MVGAAISATAVSFLVRSNRLSNSPKGNLQFINIHLSPDGP